MVYLMWEGAEKWALLDFLLELVTYAWVFICGDYKLYLLLFVYSGGGLLILMLGFVDIDAVFN